MLEFAAMPAEVAIAFLQEFLPKGPWLLCAFDPNGGPPKTVRFGRKAAI